MPDAPSVFPWFIQTWLGIRDNGFNTLVGGGRIETYTIGGYTVCIPVDALAAWTGMSCFALDSALMHYAIRRTFINDRAYLRVDRLGAWLTDSTAVHLDDIAHAQRARMEALA